MITVILYLCVLVIVVIVTASLSELFTEEHIMGPLVKKLQTDNTALQAQITKIIAQNATLAANAVDPDDAPALTTIDAATVAATTAIATAINPPAST